MTMPTRFTYRHIFALLTICLLLTGCGSYAIQGRVVRGSTASIQLVSADDPRLNENNPTGGGAVIQGILEPDTPSETRPLGQVVTNGQGWFKLPVDAVGSGFLEYQAALIARREGHQGIMQTIDLPRRGERVLIVLPLGQDTLKVPKSFLDQALRDASPYLKDGQ